MTPESPTTVLSDPMAVFAFHAALVALIFWLSGRERLRKTFDVIPPVIYVYFLPMIATTVGITPSSSACRSTILVTMARASQPLATIPTLPVTLCR